MQRIPLSEVHSTLAAILIRLGFAEARAQHCARLFAETTCDGVYSHGVARFPRFVAMIHNGNVHVDASPTLAARFGAVERWQGNRGPGNLNAWTSMDRAIALAGEHGIGFVTLADTNHWMRGGTYGWQAADAGMIGICWTNTLPNVPAWGGVEPCLGNNPLVIAVPRAAGHVVLDMAMSQFSYGALESYSRRGQMLPVDGGFNAAGELTRDPAAILASNRALPIGYWKGAGLSTVLDMIAAMTSLGIATHQLGSDPLQEAGTSQVFFAIHPASLGPAGQSEHIVDEIVASLHRSPAAQPEAPIRYPGERTLQIRAENLALGIPVDPELWQQVLAL